MIGIEITLRALAARAEADRLDPEVHRWARRATDAAPDAHGKVRAIAEAMRSQFHVNYWDQVVMESENFVSLAKLVATSDVLIDAEDACLLVVATARSVGIPCQFVAVRYGQSWTCWLAYFAAGEWHLFDPTSQRPDAEPDEKVFGPVPGS